MQDRILDGVRISHSKTFENTSANKFVDSNCKKHDSVTKLICGSLLYA